MVDNLVSARLGQKVRPTGGGPSRGPGPPGMDFRGQRLRVPAELAQLDGLREALAAFLRAAGAAEADISTWQLVLSEAATNAIVHGSSHDPRRVIEALWCAGDGLVRLEIGDEGAGLHHLPHPGGPPDAARTDGRGLFLIQQACDHVEAWRGPAGFRLVMTRATPGVRAPADAPDALLDSALAEISQCYESLAAFHRLGDALIAAERLPQFFTRAAADIAKVVPHDTLALVFAPQLHESLRAELARLPCARAAAPESVGARVLATGRECVWEHPAEIADDPEWRGYACGAAVPLRAGGRTLGALVLARRLQPYLVAAELSTARTYADLFGIALTNADHAIARGHEQQALRELEIAAAMQADLLPLPAPPPQPGWRAVVRRRSARRAAGDYVDLLPLPDGGWLLVMVDVMGKGISAALFAGMVRTALHIHAGVGRPLARLVADLNAALCRQMGELTLFATCALARLSPALDRAQVANAGHCPVLWLGQHGTTREFTPSGPPLGLFADAAYAVEEHPLAPGDRLVLVTDGLYEWEPGADAGGWTHLADAIRAHAAAGGEALWERLLQRMQAAAPPAEPRDDQTLLYWERRA